MHSSFHRGRERGSDRYCDHGRGTLRGERQRNADADRNRSWTIAALDRRHGGAAGAPLAAFCATEPGGSANVASPPPGEGVRTTARFSGDRWIIQGRKSWVSSATGWDRKGADLLSVLCRTDPDAPAERGISIILVEGPASGLVFERAIDSVGHRAHLLPQFALEGVSVPGDNVLGSLGGGLALTAAS